MQSSRCAHVSQIAVSTRTVCGMCAIAVLIAMAWTDSCRAEAPADTASPRKSEDDLLSLRSVGHAMKVGISPSCTGAAHEYSVVGGVAYGGILGPSSPSTVASVSDGSGGVIVVWEDYRTGFSFDIYAQRVSEDGQPQWAPGGVAVCTSANDQFWPDIVSDGAGGAIVTWQDYRDSNYDIYAQKVNADGVLEWIPQGVAVCATGTDQKYPALDSDGAGGAIIIWEENRTGTDADIYAQRVNTDGILQWAPQGIPISAEGALATNSVLVSDGAGGTIVAWEAQGIGAQRLSADGAILWSDGGITVCAGVNQRLDPVITIDGAGGAIIVFKEAGIPEKLYAQRVNGDGALQWAPDGVGICAASGSQWVADVASDGYGGAIVTWQDNRDGVNADDIYAQRISAGGELQWDPYGVVVCDTDNGMNRKPRVVSDAGGGAIITWTYPGNDVYAQRVSSTGEPQWTPNGVAVCAACLSQSMPVIVSDGAGGCLIAWFDYRSKSDCDVYAQRVDTDGMPQWIPDGIGVCIDPGVQRHPSICSDGVGGLIVAWQEKVGGNYDIRLRRLDATGTPTWLTVVACSTVNAQVEPIVVSDGSGGAIVAWRDFRRGWPLDIYAQRVTADGAAMWTPGGVAVRTTALLTDFAIAVVPDGSGGAIFAWDELRTVGSSSADGIYAQRLSSSGVPQWYSTGALVCGATGSQNHPALVSDGAGGAFVAWEDSRSSSSKSNIYAQKISAGGVPQWVTNGVAICTAAEEQYRPCIVSDGSGGAIVAWDDRRNFYGSIYAQRIDPAGTVLWTANGAPICVTGWAQLSALVPDGVGGAIVSWEDYQEDTASIYAQRIGDSGVPQWALDGVAVFKGLLLQPNLVMTSDGGGGAIIAWQDSRSGAEYDIYAQAISAVGTPKWALNGVAVCDAPYGQETPATVSDGNDGAFVAWMDGRDGIADFVYAQHVDAAGTPGWMPNGITKVLVSRYKAAAVETGIRIEWALSDVDEKIRFSILRGSGPEWEYVELESAGIERIGMAFTFIDESCAPGMTYRYRVECEEYGTEKRILFETEAIKMPALPLILYPNYPNPFNPSTVIRFYLPETQHVVLDVYNVAGQHVKRLVEGKKEKGSYTVTWDGRNTSGIMCSSGVYFSRLTSGKHRLSRKIVMMR